MERRRYISILTNSACVRNNMNHANTEFQAMSFKDKMDIDEFALNSHTPMDLGSGEEMPGKFSAPLLLYTGG